VPRRTQRELDDAKRQDKLRDVEQQVDSGSLQIRSMTPAEREQWGPAKPATRGVRHRGASAKR
jgi:hypothetical protein